MPTSSTETHDQSIETLRGLAVILMVAGHVIGDTAGMGMSVDDGSAWRHAYLSLEYLRMPLFTVISGYVYDLRPIRTGRVTKFALGKARRLLIPYLVVSTLYIVVQSWVPTAHWHLSYADLPRVLIEPYAHFWYLYALCWVFLIVGVADLLGGLSTVGRWATALAVSILLSEWRPLATPIFAIAQAYYLLPYFVLGLGLHRYATQLEARLVLFVALPILAIGVLFHQASLFHLWTPTYWQRLSLDTCLGVLATFVIFRLRFAWTPLARVGIYSYGIYLLHVFGTAGARIGLHSAGVDVAAVVFLVALAAGVALPIVVERVIDRLPTLRLLILGTSTPLRVASEAAKTDGALKSKDALVLSKDPIERNGDLK